MENFGGRSVFFVRDAERALNFYTESLGFNLDWNHEEDGRPFVVQVSLFGIQLILNQEEDWTVGWAGHGRIFVGLDDGQQEVLRRHIKEKSIATTVIRWGAPTLVIRDLDGNELFFWFPRGEIWEAEAK